MKVMIMIIQRGGKKEKKNQVEMRGESQDTYTKIVDLVFIINLC